MRLTTVPTAKLGTDRADHLDVGIDEVGDGGRPGRSIG